MSIYTNDANENKRTILAVVLSVIVISGAFWLQNTFYPPQPAKQTEQTAAKPQDAATPAAVPTGGATLEVGGANPAAAIAQPAGSLAVLKDSQPAAERSYTIETDLLEAVLSNRGGELVSLKLKKHKDKNGHVDLIVPGTKDVKGFSVAFGGAQAAPVRELMNATVSPDGKTIEFSLRLTAGVAGRAAPVVLDYTKRFVFKDGEYLFELDVGFKNAENVAIPLNQDGVAYSLLFGPRIGPNIEQMGSNTDYRKIITYADGKRKIEKQKDQAWSPSTQPMWSAIAGKYFAFVAIPQLVSFKTSYLESKPGLSQTTALTFSRPQIPSSMVTDAWFFYFGPMTNTDLARYDYPDRNSFGLQGLKLENVLDSANPLKWLEDILKFAMNLFYKLVPNYGVAIIFLTILVKVLFYPLTKKGSLASARMAELQPKMQELQAKYKNNPQKLNAELAEFYKKEGYNPMSGCLPMLIQFPLFIAMYNLFNTHFDLRGASFIPGWIPDLSVPESIWNFGGYSLPILGWTDLRLLPIIYVGSQLLYGKFTQMPQSGQSASQMKMMMYAMPIIFFFVLYNVPSGLLVFWIAQNILTIIQQIIINDYLKAHKAKAAAARLGSK